MKHHPSTVASHGTALPSDLDGISPYARKALADMIRAAAISKFSQQHGAPSVDDWDDNLRMMFAISHPGVKL